MSVSAVYVLHAIVNSSTAITQLGNVSVSPGIRTLVSHAAGMVNPQSIINLKQNPGITFSSTQIKSLLDLTGVSIADLSATNTDIYFKAAVDGGSRVANASTSHIRLRAADAILDIGSITAGDESEAVASGRLICKYDGTNEPIVAAGSVALSGTSTSNEHFVSGPVFINLGSGSTQLTGIKDITIDFGRTLIEEGSDGELYMSFVAEGSVAPKVTVRGVNVPWATFGLNGSSISGLSVYLRKCGTTGRVANGTAQHIKFTATTGLAYISESSAGDNGPVMTTVTIELAAADSTSAAIAVNTASAITS